MVDVSHRGTEGARATTTTARGIRQARVGATFIQTKCLQQLGPSSAGLGTRAQGWVAHKCMEATIALPQLLALVGCQALHGQEALPCTYCWFED